MARPSLDLASRDPYRRKPRKYGRDKPGDSSALHSHPDYLVYNLEDGKVKFGGPSGEGEEVELKAGDVMWRDAEDHTAEGIGSTDVHALLFELK
jgi:quercetin dioxygenase-like cupin family protein